MRTLEQSQFCVTPFVSRNQNVRNGGQVYLFVLTELRVILTNHNSSNYIYNSNLTTKITWIQGKSDSWRKLGLRLMNHWIFYGRHTRIFLAWHGRPSLLGSNSLWSWNSNNSEKATKSLKKISLFIRCHKVMYFNNIYF